MFPVFYFAPMNNFSAQLELTAVSLIHAAHISSNSRYLAAPLAAKFPRLDSLEYLFLRKEKDALEPSKHLNECFSKTE